MILLVDMQSFYASVEKSLRPELRNLPVVISGDPERRSGVVLAACPIAKSYGIRNAATLWEAQQACPEVVVVRPRMELYLKTSLYLTQLLERFSDRVEPYSIDEQFIDVRGSERLFGKPVEIAQKIQKTIGEELNIYARVGIGSNKVLAKMACDNFAKKNKTGIYQLDEQNIKIDLWKQPIGNMFGVGSRMRRHLERMGIRTIGDLAQYPVERLKKRWGINGQVLWMTANGIDHSPVTRNSFVRRKGIGHHMTLPRDYQTAEEIQIVMLELCEEVCRRARRHHLMGRTISVGVRGAIYHAPTGFHRQTTLPDPTYDTRTVFHHAWQLFLTHWDEQPIRSLGIHLGQLEADQYVQLDLFEDREKQIRLGTAMDQIKERFGSTSILWASSLHPASQVQERSRKIGGHYR